MYTLSENLPRREANVQNGKGLTKSIDLATKAQMYDHARLFSHIYLEPGCSIGYHTHSHETEFYYILKGEAVFDDNHEQEVLLHAGDVAATGYGQGHSLENKSQETVELIALIVTE
jgi:mannose-6-phosphate isomerase-like protein (cupin superfamily)